MSYLKTLIPFTFPLIFTVIGCKIKQGLLSSNSPLRGVDWTLIENGKPVKANGELLYIHFLSKKFEGYAGCNAVSGNYTIQGAQISLQKSESSQANCEDTRVQDTFLSLLSQANRFRIRGEEVSLYKGKMLLLQFRKRHTY